MNINIKTIKKDLIEKYNCNYICIIEYIDDYFVKTCDILDSGVSYRYFNILDSNNLIEVKDENLLSILRKYNETSSNIVY